jgi:hypothetical protein
VTQPGETDQERAFARVVWLLRDYLPDLIVIGGWVPYLYKRYGGLHWVGQQSRTAEVDVLTLPPLAVHDGISLDATLRAAGLKPHQHVGPSAVWEASSESGEQIEFLTPLVGTAMQRGSTVGLSGHGRVGAIMLQGLEFLARHTMTLTVPVGEFEGRLQEVKVRVPRLGAYVVNKAATVLARQAHASAQNPKQAKDLVYLHDVMAAGEAARLRVEADITEMWAGAPKTSPERGAIRSATNNIAILLEGSVGLITSAAQELGTRDSRTSIAAAASIRGQLTDLEEMLRTIQASRRKRSDAG